MLTFYFAPGSSSMAPHIALHEVGAAFEARPISFAKRETRDPAFRALNPEGKVPLLLIDGRPMSEVAGILTYLAGAYPDARLMPTNDPEAEGQVVSWMSFLASTVHPARREGAEAARAVYARIEPRLAGKEWLVGDYSIADIHLFRLFWRFCFPNPPEPAEFPNLSAHYARMMKRPAVIATIAAEAVIGYELPA
jgi:glutathione S-transferase